jgi:dolichol-phosphate mannosyltransferase
MKLSIVIPAHNEREAIGPTVAQLVDTLQAAGIPFEIVVVNDHSSDGTDEVLDQLAHAYPMVRWVSNERPGGFGYAIRAGLDAFRGDAVCIVMADASDDPNDVVAYYRKLQEGYECVFGSRFIRKSRVVDYPRLKLAINRMANWFIRVLFRIRLNDTTNAFKAYRREVIEGVQPILSPHFNITVELPLKAIIRGYTYAMVPINWYNRTTGVSKLKIQEMGSRYLFIVLYAWLEKRLSRGDYLRRGPGTTRITGGRPVTVADAASQAPIVPPTHGPVRS